MNFLASTIRKIIYFISFCAVINYYGDASRRAHAKQWESQISTKDGGIYTARYTSLTSEIMLIRLYRTGENKLLAERTFNHSDMPRIFWTENFLLYDSNDLSIFYDGAISLPPTWIDTLLAQLP